MLKKKKLLLIGIIMLAILFIFVVYKNLTFNKKQSLLNDILTQNSNIMIEETLKKIEIDSIDSLYLIKDINNYIHYIMIDMNEILLHSKLLGGNEAFKDYDLDWYVKHNNEKMKFAFYGILYNHNIVKLSVNNIEIPVINYEGYKVFFSTEKFDVPIRIEGYSQSGETIYKKY